jgi:hypothetical protein
MVANQYLVVVGYPGMGFKLKPVIFGDADSQARLVAVADEQSLCN